MFKMELTIKIIKKHHQRINHNKKNIIIFQLIHLDWKWIFKRYEKKANMGNKVFNVREKITTWIVCWNMFKERSLIRKICQ